MSETLNQYYTVPTLHQINSDRSTLILAELRKMNEHLSSRIDEMNHRLKTLEDWILINTSDGK